MGVADWTVACLIPILGPSCVSSQWGASTWSSRFLSISLEQMLGKMHCQMPAILGVENSD